MARQFANDRTRRVARESIETAGSRLSGGIDRLETALSTTPSPERLLRFDFAARRCFEIGRALHKPQRVLRGVQRHSAADLGLKSFRPSLRRCSSYGGNLSSGSQSVGRGYGHRSRLYTPLFLLSATLVPLTGCGPVLLRADFDQLQEGQGVPTDLPGDPTGDVAWFVEHTATIVDSEALGSLALRFANDEQAAVPVGSLSGRKAADNSRIFTYAWSGVVLELGEGMRLRLSPENGFGDGAVRITFRDGEVFAATNPPGEAGLVLESNLGGFELNQRHRFVVVANQSTQEVSVLYLPSGAGAGVTENFPLLDPGYFLSKTPRLTMLYLGEGDLLPEGEGVYHLDDAEILAAPPQ